MGTFCVYYLCRSWEKFDLGKGSEKDEIETAKRGRRRKREKEAKQGQTQQARTVLGLPKLDKCQGLQPVASSTSSNAREASSSRPVPGTEGTLHPNKRGYALAGNMGRVVPLR